MNGLQLAVVSMLLALSVSCTSGTCVGNSCPEQHASASAAGLLGATASGCDSKTYSVSSRGVTVRTFDTPVVDVRWAGNWSRSEGDQVIFALLRGDDFYVGGHLWKSPDYGKNWADATKALTDALPASAAQEEDNQGVLDIHYHAWQPGHILLQGPAYYYWVTKDYGKTFTAYQTPGDQTLGFWMELKIHPRVPDWILAKVRRKDCLVDASSNACAHDLFVSKDFGAGWTNLTENSKGKIAAFWDFDWGAALTHTDPAKQIEDEVIFATVYEEASAMKGPYPGWDKDLHFVRSDDLFDTKHEKLVACGNQFEIVAHRLFLAMPADCPVAPDGSKRSVPSGADERNSVSLYTSEDNAQTYKPACLPVKDLDLGYNLVTTHDGKGAFVVVDHDEREPGAAAAPVSYVYSAGYDASMFSLSLPRNYHTEHIADFGRVEAMPGTYLANQLDASRIDNPTSKPRDLPWSSFLQTKITFNGGGQWTELKHPSSYNYEECNACRDTDPAKCQLHLHGLAGWVEGLDARPSFYSHWNAPGIVMAVGNVGEFLDPAADATCTWLSRDGGLTWEDVAPYASIYEFGDHGSLLVSANYQSEGPTTEIKFSRDEGHCWDAIKLSTAFDVHNVRVEPKGASHIFMVHGSECRKSAANPTCTWDPRNSSKRKGVTYVINFRELLGDDYKVCTEQDYEQWQPPGDGRCLLGKQYTLQRQKQSSTCFNGIGWSRDIKNVTTCPCSHDDFECDYGYQRVGNSSCLPMLGISPNDCEQIANGNWYQSESHLRLLHNDTCSHVERVVTDSDGHGTCVGPNCPNGSQHKGRGALAKFFIFLVIVGLCTTIGVWWFFFANDSMKSMVEELLAPVIAFFDSCFSWVHDKISSLTGRQRQDAENAYFQPLAGGDELALDEEDARSPPLFPMR